MFAPGVRVVRGPDWNWKNQGDYFINDISIISLSYYNILKFTFC